MLTSSQILLCIDDHLEMLRVRKVNLERLGYSVLTATSISVAIDLLQRIPVAAVLLQYRTDGMDAEAVAYLIKQRFPRQPIILLSAYSDMPERILWLVDEHILKSEYPQRLDRAIQRASGADAA